MGMVWNELEVMVVPKVGEPIIFEFGLDNEANAELTGERDLFKGADTSGKIQAGIENGFKDPEFDEYEDKDEADTNNLTWFISGFDYDGNYPKFTKKLKKLKPNDIQYIVLMTNDEKLGGDREYSWYRYDLTTGEVTKGNGQGKREGGTDKFASNRCIPSAEEYLKSLI